MSLRKAAEMALEFVEWLCGDDHSVKPKNSALETREALRTALAQPEQESEWIEDGFGAMWQKCGKKDCGKFVVRVGKVDCWNGDCPEEKNNG
jgi:hypothetical protein